MVRSQRLRVQFPAVAQGAGCRAPAAGNRLCHASYVVFLFSVVKRYGCCAGPKRWEGGNAIAFLCWQPCYNRVTILVLLAAILSPCQSTRPADRHAIAWPKQQHGWPLYNWFLRTLALLHAMLSLWQSISPVGLRTIAT